MPQNYQPLLNCSFNFITSILNKITVATKKDYPSTCYIHLCKVLNFRNLPK
ncbi:unnamed protein product [Brugia timori]|uniref:Uncharacterized protein n=1 Tax=Brugia timori TaxID=42155 RepID=A0A0R3QGM7_9BILA|nr:unnamed protein product [Brugia timori]